jgi:cell division protein FtsQ
MIIKLLLRGLVLFVITSLLYFCFYSMQWPIGGVEIKKREGHLAESTLNEILTPYLESSWLAVDISGIRNDIEMLPWVGRVDVMRSYPDKIKILIVEREAVASYGVSSLVSSNGDIFTPDIMPQNDLPRLDVQKQYFIDVFSSFKLLQNKISKDDALPDYVSSFKYSPVSGYQAVFSNGLVVYFGLGDFSELLRKFANYYPKVSVSYSKSSRIKKFDMRYPNGAAIS